MYLVLHVAGIMRNSIHVLRGRIDYFLDMVYCEDQDFLKQVFVIYLL